MGDDEPDKVYVNYSQLHDACLGEKSGVINQNNLYKNQLVQWDTAYNKLNKSCITQSIECKPTRNTCESIYNFTCLEENKTYIQSLKKRVNYLEALSEDCYFDSEDCNDANETLIEELEDCNDKLDDLKDMLED